MSTVRSVVIGVQTTATGLLLVNRAEFLPIPAPVVSEGSNWYSAVWSADLFIATGNGRRPGIAVGVFPNNPVEMYCKVTGRVQP